MYSIEQLTRLPRLSIILNFKEPIYDLNMFKKIFDYGIIEYFNLTKSVQSIELAGISRITFKIVMANIDEIHVFLHDIKVKCWSMECWLIKYGHPKKILFTRTDSQRQDFVLEEDWFWQIEYEILTDFSNASL